MIDTAATMTDARFISRSGRRLLVSCALLASDVLTLSLATVTATVVRFGQLRHVQAVPELGAALNIQFVDLSVVVVIVWVAVMWMEHLYDVDRVFWGTGEYARVSRALLSGLAGFIIASFLLHIPAVSRGWVLLSWGFGTAFAIAGRSIVRVSLASVRRRGHLLRPALIVGYNEEAAELIRRFASDQSSGLFPVACLASSRADRLSLNSCVQSVPCIGSAGDIKEVLDDTVVDTVIIASTAFDPEVLSRIIADMRGRDVDIQMSSGLLDVTTSRVLIREISGVPLITIRGVTFTPMQRFVKRTFDLSLCGMAVVLGMPVWLLIAAAIKAESKGPVFYSQTRVGRSGELFEMLKFRSMTADAHSKRDALAVENEASGPLFKIHNDPRITRVGKWIRKFSLDEFPQLINVLRGEMSLVGPRPPLPEESAQYSDYHWRRMEVLPGMTGLWQVSGRSRLTFEEMIRLDLFYIENWSVGFDLSVMARTVPAVLLARGSY